MDERVRARFFLFQRGKNRNQHPSGTFPLFLVITSKRGPPSVAGADTHATQPQVVLECSSVQALVFAGVPRGRGRFSRVVGQKALRGYFV